MKYIFVRHGKTHFNEIQLKQGWCDSPLTKQGIKEIENMAEQLKDCLLYTSTFHMKGGRTMKIVVLQGSLLVNDQ